MPNETMNTVDQHISTPFITACEEIARDYFNQFGRSQEALLAKERELQSKIRELTKARETISEIEENLSVLAATKRAEAYSRLFGMAELRAYLEEQVWELECVLAILKSPKFA